VIPDAAVEAASRAMLAAGNYSGEWEDLPAFMQDQFTRDARVALAAAAPDLIAEAIAREYEAGAAALGDGIAIYAINLRARAESIRAASPRGNAQ